jgi:DNA excision repair protein ERCC-6
MEEVPLPPPMVGNVAEITSRETLEKALFDSFASNDQQEAARERERAKRQKQENEVRSRLRVLEEKLAEAPEGRSSVLQKKIEVEEEKLQKLQSESAAESELRELEEEDARRHEPQNELISAGLITPFEESLPLDKHPRRATVASRLLRRKGALQDDTDDSVYLQRLRNWKSGADLMDEPDEEEEEPPMVLQEEVEEEDEDEDEEAVGRANDVDEEDDFELRFDSEEEVKADGVAEETAAPVECGECRKVRGVEQVMEVLGIESLAHCKYDLPRLLKDSRFNPQRALERIMTEEEAVAEKFPRAAQCPHRYVVAAKKAKPKKVATKRPRAEPLPRSASAAGAAKAGESKKVKRVAPTPLELPWEIVEQLKAGQTASVHIEDGFRVPLEAYDCLFEYQRTALRWMWELHKQNVGGILADEMGLGKTIQICCFLYGLQHSNLLSAPTLLVCPATVMKQWVSELHKWAPPFRVVMLHSSNDKNPSGLSYSKDTGLLRAIGSRGNGIVVTTFEGLRRSKDTLLSVNWAYAILDEGHKIRNPDADITLSCKQLKTHRRIILTGTPIQNSLKELWSLLDFVYPGKLGTLPIFQREFEVPIKLGGYASASPSQVMTAFRCSTVLRDLIKPYMLRRMKADVDVALPDKTEQVMMCRLTVDQVKAYRQWIKSDEVQRILDGRINALYGISFLRKICNHPDLLRLGKEVSPEADPDYGDYRKSAKLLVLHEMLPQWKREGHRVLIFSQGVQMLNILVKYVKAQGHSYLRMDGGTAVQSRMPLIEQFNTDKSVFLFLLTTRVGGIGVNLTGADRVVIFDPDWNPSTDMQARERAWRIGQTRNVCVYRLVTVGTIEEKVLHRQIFKTFLTQKVLNNPRQRRFFSSKDMADLFTLGNEYSTGATPTRDSETSRIFFDMRDKVTVPMPPQNVAKRSAEDRDDDVLLRTLLSKNERMVSALNHTAMTENQPNEYDILQLEANDIAQKAAQKLKESHRLVSEAVVTEPTWTGRRGQAGMQPRFGRTIDSLRAVGGAERGIRNRFGQGAGSGLVLVENDNSAKSHAPEGVSAGASSAELLAAIKKRKADGGAPKSKEDEQGERLLDSLVTYLWGSGGSADSDELVGMFRGKLNTPEEKFAFRAMLREVAEFNPKKKVWVLRAKWRNS